MTHKELIKTIIDLLEEYDGSIFACDYGDEIALSTNDCNGKKTHVTHFDGLINKHSMEHITSEWVQKGETMRVETAIKNLKKAIKKETTQRKCKNCEKCPYYREDYSYTWNCFGCRLELLTHYLGEYESTGRKDK